MAAADGPGGSCRLLSAVCSCTLLWRRVPVNLGTGMDSLGCHPHRLLHARTHAPYTGAARAAGDAAGGARQRQPLLVSGSPRKRQVRGCCGHHSCIYIARKAALAAPCGMQSGCLPASPTVLPPKRTCQPRFRSPIALLPLAWSSLQGARAGGDMEPLRRTPAAARGARKPRAAASRLPRAASASGGCSLHVQVVEVGWGVSLAGCHSC